MDVNGKRCEAQPPKLGVNKIDKTCPKSPTLSNCVKQKFNWTDVQTSNQPLSSCSVPSHMQTWANEGRMHEWPRLCTQWLERVAHMQESH